MIEKRFTYVNLLEVEMIFDEETERGYYFNGENCTTDDVKDLIQLLNEQQATISALKEENDQLQQILKDIVGATDETYTKNKNIYKVTVVFDGKMYNQIRRCLNE